MERKQATKRGNFVEMASEVEVQSQSLPNLTRDYCPRRPRKLIKSKVRNHSNITSGMCKKRGGGQKKAPKLRTNGKLSADEGHAKGVKKSKKILDVTCG